MKLSKFLVKIGATAAFPLLGLSALLWPRAQSLAEVVFGLFIVSLGLMVQWFIVVIWTEL